MSDNIKVAVRVRPLISREIKDKLKELWEIKNNTIYPLDPITNRKTADGYNFDHIFDQTCTNKDIYDTLVKPVVTKALNGFNATIFAYGQTSSGKTYTMMGNSNECGLIFKTVENIFEEIEQSENRQFLLRVSYMEIYNEKINDLLDTSNIVKIHEDYNGTIVVNAKEEVVKSPQVILNLMKKGDKIRKIGETNMNEKSSRSHSIFRIIIESSDINNQGAVKMAHLNLVDLAGSERVDQTKTTGKRLKEGSHINRSLSTLCTVIKQLNENKDFINFRDSKLTRLLQSSLGGNTLTAFICAVTPASLEETHSTLSFASRAKTIKNKPKQNEILDERASLNAYALEIKKLKKALEAANDNTNAQEMLNKKLEEEIISLQKKIIYSSYTNSEITNKKNNNRRRTWSAPVRNGTPLKALSVIPENEFLQNDEKFKKISLLQYPIVENETAPLNETKSELIEDSPVSDKENRASNEKFNESQEIISWLVSNTEKPKKLIQKHLEIVQEEYKTLEELTKTEILFLKEEKDKLDERNNKLTSDLCDVMNKNKTLEDRINELINVVNNEKQRNELLENKNNELKNDIKKIQIDAQKKNDYEYLLELQEQKFKKREKELLERLQEEREKVTSSESLEDNSTINISIDILNNCKQQMNLIKSKLESEEPLNNINEFIKNIHESLKVNNAIKEVKKMENLSEIILLLISNDAFVELFTKEKQDLMNQVKLLENKKQSYDMLVRAQQKEIKEMSVQILNYKNKIDVYQNQPKMTQSIQTEDDINELLQLKDKKIEDLTDLVAVYTSKLNKESITTDEKDKEIEVLSDQIMNYVTEVDDLKREFDLLNQKYMKEITAIQTEFQNEKSVLQSKITQLELDLIKSQEKLRESDDVIKKFNVVKKEFDLLNQKRVIEIAAIQTEFQNEKSVLQSKITQLELELIKSQEKLKESDDVIKKFNVVSDELNLYKKNVEDQQQIINELNSKTMECQEVNDEISTLIQEIATKEHDLQDLQKKLIEQINLNSSYINYIKDLKESNNEFNKNLELEKEKTLEQITECAKKQEQINKLESELEKCETAMKEQKKEFNNYMNKYNVQADENINLKIELRKLQEEIQSLTVKLENNVEIQSLLKSKTNLLTQKDEEIHSLMCEISKREQELCNFKIETKELNNELNILQQEIKMFEKKVENNTIAITEKQHLLEITSDLLTQKEKEIDKLQSNVSENVNEINCLKTQIDQSNKNIEDKTIEINKLNEQINKYNNDITLIFSEKNNLHEQLEKHSSTISDLEKTLIKYKDTINNLKEYIEVKYKNTVNSSCQTDSFDELINEILRAEREVMTNNIYEKLQISKEADYSEFIKKINNLERENASHISTINLIETNLNQKNAELQRLLKELEILNKSKKELKNECAAMIRKKEMWKNEMVTKAKAEIRKSLQDLKAENEYLEAQIRLKTVSYDTLTTQFQAELQKKCLKTTEIETLQKRIRKLEESNETLKKLVNENQEKAYIDINDAYEKYNKAKTENAQLMKQLQECEKDIAQLQSAIQLEKRDNKGFIEQLRLMEESHEKAKLEINELQKSKEPLKFETSELKKSKEFSRKEHRKSLHDSFRNIEENAEDERTEKSKSEINCEVCNEISKFMNKNPEDQRTEFIQLQTNYTKLVNKNKKLMNLCVIRKKKLDELEHK